VLDVGSGSGYLSAVFHHLVSTDEISGRIVGIDHIPELVESSIQNLQKDGLGEALKEGKIEIITGDGREGNIHLFLKTAQHANDRQAMPVVVSYLGFKLLLFIINTESLT
jgi:hypothetical protein